jgi:hypothetical protein
MTAEEGVFNVATWIITDFKPHFSEQRKKLKFLLSLLDSREQQLK